MCLIILPTPQLLGVSPYKERFDQFLEDIQNLGYMGVMRERWNEIKRLTNLTYPASCR